MFTVKKTPGSAKTPSSSGTGLLDIVCRPPVQCTSSIPNSEATPTSDFPVLRSQLLLEHASDKTLELYTIPCCQMITHH